MKIIKNYTSDIQLFKKSATKIAIAFKAFKTKIHNKQENQFGFKEFQYINNKNPTASKEYYLHVETKKIIYMPKKNPPYKKSGTFKEIVKEDKKMISFNLLTQQKWDYTSNEIIKILNELSITTFQPTYEANNNVFIANNRGIGLDIIRHDRIPLFYFKNILLDVKKLHIAGYFYRDFKPGNMVIDELNKLWIIDLDTLTRKELPNKKMAGTKTYSTPALLQEIYHNKNYDLLKTADDYALALTLLQCNSGFFKPEIKIEDEFKEIIGVKITFPILQWINTNIKKNYKKKFMFLILNPIEYYRLFKATDHLVDMLNLTKINNLCPKRQQKKIYKTKQK